LEAGLEGFAAVFLVDAFVPAVLLSGTFFALDAGVFDVGFFPVTSFLAVSRREDEVVFLVEVVLPTDFEDGFKAFLVAGPALVFVVVLPFVAVFVGLAATLGSLTSFLTVALFVASLDSLVAVSLVADFFAVEDFAALVAVVDLDLVDFTGTFLVVVGLDAFAGLFSLVSVSSFLVVLFGGSLTRPERPLGRKKIPLSAPLEIALLS